MKCRWMPVRSSTKCVVLQRKCNRTNAISGGSFQFCGWPRPWSLVADAVVEDLLQLLTAGFGTNATSRDVGFSNRPFGVKRFQTIHQHSVDVAHGLVLLFGIGAKALPSWDSKTRRNNLWDGLAVSVTAGPSGHTISPHPSSREGHHSTAQWNSSFLLLD